MILVKCKTSGLLEKNTKVLECFRKASESNLQTAHLCCDWPMVPFAFEAIERILWLELLLLSAHILLLLFFFFLRLQVALMQGGAAECTWLGSGSS